MKQFFLYLFVCLLCWSNTFAQSWFPLGANYTFTQHFWEYPFHVKPATWTVVDTIRVKDMLCKRFVLTKGATYGSDTNNFVMYVYDSNSVVYWYRPHLDSFSVLYDFNKNVGDTWEIFGVKGILPSADTIGCTLTAKVTEKDTISINGFPLRRINIQIEKFLGSLGGFSGKIIEFIGHLERPRPDPFYSCHAISESSDFFGMRCFDHPEIGFHDFKIVPYCNYVSTNVSDVQRATDLTISPNPCSFEFEITLKGQFANNVNVKVYNVLGQIIFQNNLASIRNKIVTKDWLPGLYFLEFTQQGQPIAATKLLKI